jgi:ferredoxin
MALLCTAALCTGCELCAQICPEDAIRVEPGLRWTPASFAEREVATAEGWACPKCGKVFATRRAIDSVASRLAERLPEANTDLLRLCPDCRVISAFLER